MQRDQCLVWIDLEMTGLNIEQDVILEIATIITDFQLQEIAQGPHLVIHQSDEVLANMNAWCKEHHAKSGLIKAVQESKITFEQAYKETLEFIVEHCKHGTALLSGSSIWQDRVFLSKYMPGIVDHLFYKMIDVSTVKELIKRWYPKNKLADLKKQEAHRALDDIRESIAGLKIYREHFFIK